MKSEIIHTENKTHMNDHIIKIITAVSFVAAVAVSAWLGMQYLSIKRHEVANEARFQCAQSSRYQVTERQTGATTWYPMEELYQKCLKEKGI